MDEFIKTWVKIKRDSNVKPLVKRDRCKVLWQELKKVISLDGDVFECGVYKGGTAMLLSTLVSKHKTLHLFDTFEGVPEPNPKKDVYKGGEWSEASLGEVKEAVNFMNHACKVKFYKGFIPDTFKGLDDVKISFAHIDVDIYQSYLDCLEFIYPKMVDGGIIIFDDYGFEDCIGAKLAVDEFFEDKTDKVIKLETKQAMVKIKK